MPRKKGLLLGLLANIESKNVGSVVTLLTSSEEGVTGLHLVADNDHHLQVGDPSGIRLLLALAKEHPKIQNAMAKALTADTLRLIRTSPVSGVFSGFIDLAKKDDGIYSVLADALDAKTFGGIVRDAYYGSRIILERLFDLAKNEPVAKKDGIRSAMVTFLAAQQPRDLALLSQHFLNLAEKCDDICKAIRDVFAQSIDDSGCIHMEKVQFEFLAKQALENRDFWLRIRNLLDKNNCAALCRSAFALKNVISFILLFDNLSKPELRAITSALRKDLNSFSESWYYDFSLYNSYFGALGKIPFEKSSSEHKKVLDLKGFDGFSKALKLFLKKKAEDPNFDFGSRCCGDTLLGALIDKHFGSGKSKTRQLVDGYETKQKQEAAKAAQPASEGAAPKVEGTTTAVVVSENPPEAVESQQIEKPVGAVVASDDNDDEYEGFFKQESDTFGARPEPVEQQVIGAGQPRREIWEELFQPATEQEESPPSYEQVIEEDRVKRLADAQRQPDELKARQRRRVEEAAERRPQQQDEAMSRAMNDRAGDSNQNPALFGLKHEGPPPWKGRSTATTEAPRTPRQRDETVKRVAFA